MSNPITIKEASESFFAPWYSGENLAAGDRVSTPRDAAAAAIIAALNTNGEQGIIRVVASTSDQRTATRKHLEAMASVKDLKPWVERMTPDAITFSSGVSIVVDANDVRFVTDALATIVLSDVAPTTVMRLVVLAPDDEAPIEGEGEQLVVLRIVSAPERLPDEPLASAPAPATTSRAPPTPPPVPDPVRFHRQLEYPKPGVA